MGGAKVITLGSGVTPPTATQLGYTTSIGVPGGAVINTGFAGIVGPPPHNVPMGNITVGPGVWVVMFSCVFTSQSNPSTIFCQLLVSPNNATLPPSDNSFVSQNDDFCPTMTGSPNVYSTANFTNVFHFSGINNVLKIGAGALGNSATVEARNSNWNYLRVLRIA